MKKINRTAFWASVIASIFITGFVMNSYFASQTEYAGGISQATNELQPSSESSLPIEQPVTRIALAGPLADASAEVSGLAWYGDYLIILPQYPHRMSESGDGVIYALHKADILAYLDGESSAPLEPIAIMLEAPGLRKKISGYEGFEAIGFSANRAFLTIEGGEDHEIGEDHGMMGYLVSGLMAPDMSKLVLDTGAIVPIEPQTKLGNKSDEALIVLDDRLVTFYEVNGVEFNPQPVAHVFSLDLQPQDTLLFPSLEYRLTDAALASDGNHFWVMNSLFLGDFDLRAESDPLADAFGRGPTHAKFDVVERLVEMQYEPTGITLTSTAPIQLELNFIAGNNWEGLVLLDERGFLLMTDKFPETILGFVPMP